MHIAKDLHRLVGGVVALEHLAAENHARGFDLLGKTNFLFARQQWDRAHLREVHANRVVNALRALFGERLFNSRLHLGVVEDVLFDIKVVRLRRVFFAANFAFGSLLLALVLLDLQLGRGEGRSGRLGRAVGTRVRAARLLRIIALKLQVGLKRRVEADIVVATNLYLVDHFDLMLTHEDEQLVDLLRIDKLVGKASI